jgi:hypothetical protein
VLQGFHCFCKADRAHYVTAWTGVHLRQRADVYVSLLDGGSLARGLEAEVAGCAVDEGSAIGGGGPAIGG